ncbi:hypothetical protein INT48_000054 [Thamnidium elegans]|uniref:Uncharacterized protein n=1 Tax=Thamnidium elegans TaxID=101142 RepID=A0A8H7SP12_9FUNG|nr:hypothetical protein INT48_000054 [Thamnidium elegans]
MLNPFSQPGMPMFSRSHNPVCCAVIPLKFGVPLVLTSWIGISLYFASLSFMGKSRTTAMIVFGILNTVFVVICLCGYIIHLFRRTFTSYRQYVKVLACWVATILLDMLVNFIVFYIKKNEFQSWCQTSALDNLNLHFKNSTLLDQSIQHPTIIFNCTKLFNVEAEFSFACTVLMVMIYIYWVSFIIKVSRNFTLQGPHIQMQQPPNLVPIHQTYQKPPMDKNIILT